MNIIIEMMRSFLLYEEIVEGFPEPVKNMIKLKNKEFILTKKGPVNVQMVFQREEDNDRL